ncbi:hypothetical protein FA15DRAFT_665687 [Coprinopsis marcescibilis]|uniref:MARVEL domain-containing protein n=1 Tax=Coprinopsis marcescibilis TaxID=230819 RepID=A0A5C3LI21_COPMA|nr:hypothetical protein FA15DRAFT_665687 [Coprinopsis marcescibilis]
MDRISDLFHKLAPPKSTSHPSTTLAGGIGNGGHGMVPFDDNMIVSKPVIVAHATQIFFNFLAMCCFAAVASFQAKWGVGPSGLSGFAIFASIATILLSSFMLLVPVAYEKYDKFVQTARLLKEVRVSFILTGTGVLLNLIIAFSTIISSFTQPGCKDPEKDPSAEEKGEEFKNGLFGWCNTKKAGSFFFLFGFFAWAASATLLFLAWRSGKLTQRRDPPFARPTQQPSEDQDDEEDGDGYTHVASPVRTQHNQRYDEESVPQDPYDSPSNRYSSHIPASNNIPAAGRPSIDAYGAFSDPAPTGFGNSYGAPPQVGGGGGLNTPYDPPPINYGTPPRMASTAPILPEPELGPRVSRTMQYADPYAAVRASVAGARQSSPGNVPAAAPPSYDNYGYH